MAEDIDTARLELDERLERAFDGTTPALITAAVDALIAAVRAVTTQEAIAFIKARSDVETPVVKPGMWFAAGYVQDHFPR